MNTLSRKLHHRYTALLGAVLLVGMMPASAVFAKASTPPPAPGPAAAAPAAPAAPDANAPTAPEPRQEHGHWHHNSNHVNVNVDSDDNSVFNLGGNSELAAGDQADNVVSVLGNSTSAGEVTHAVVSVLGNTHVTGPVGDSAVAVLGNVYVDSPVEHDVVAVLGNITLGPNADVGGNLVAVGGMVTRDPASKVRGSVQNVGAFRHSDKFRPWIEHCFFLGRPLAFTSGIGWAWTLAFMALAAYLFAALLFAPAVERCMQVLEKYPGQSLLTMILTIIATPIVFVILCITVVGIIAVPFLAIALFLAKFFGKLVVLAWIGRRVLMRSAQPANTMHTVSAVLVGGLLVMLLYCIPFFGIILYYLLGLLGLGVVIYTLLLQIQERRPAAAVAGASPEPALAAAAAVAADGTAHAAPSPSPSPSPASPAGAKPTRISGEAAIALPRAGFWIRMGALLLDAVLVGVVMHLIDASSDWFLIMLAAYGVTMWRLRGSTVGGIIFNLAVVRHDGREMDWGTSIVRGLSSFLSLFALGLGFIWIAIDAENRSWHDKIAGTVVVRVP